VSDLASVRAQHRAVRYTVRIPMRADLVDEIKELERQAKRERAIDDRENREPVAPGLAVRIQELEDQVADSEVAFTFESIGQRATAKLLADNPPTDEQKAQAEENGVSLAFNPDTYPPQLLAATCVSHTSTVEDWTDIWETWSTGQVTQLWAACLATNQGSADAGPKSLIASEILRGSAKSSTTARR
jgi:hypothetical protein